MSKPLFPHGESILSPGILSGPFPKTTPDLGRVLQVPGNTLLLDGEFYRFGDNLFIIGADGEHFTLEHYFSIDPPPILTTANGRFLLPETVELLLIPDPSDIQTVMVAGPTIAVGAVDPIGHVSQISGKVTAKTKSDVVRSLRKGDPIFQEDVIKTEDAGLIKLIFRDQTIFQLGEKASLVLNKYVFNPGTTQNTFEATVLRGVFKYTSGDLAHLSTGRHTILKTPMAVIGVRGSELQGEVAEDGQTTIVHTSGMLDISDAQGMGTVTLLEPGMATIVTFDEGPRPAFKASKDILDRLNDQLPPVLPGNQPEASGEGDALGNKPLIAAYGDMITDLEYRGFPILDVKGLDLENMSPEQRQALKDDFQELLLLLPPPSVEPELFYGVFLDSPVKGIRYQTDTRNGLTDSNGQFIFKAGEVVRFSIGDIELGQVDMGLVQSGSTIVTPKVLAATATDNAEAQTAIQSNLIRLLQTLDSDGDPNNGITITEIAQQHAVGETTIDVTQPEDTFAENDDLTSFLAKAKDIAKEDVVLVDRDLAWVHYNQTLTLVENLENNITVQNASFLFAIEDKHLLFEISSEIFQDQTGAELTYSVASLPDWISFDPNSLTLRGTPTNEDVGNVSFEVTATSTAGGKGSVNYVLMVSNTNDAPIVNVPMPDHAVPLDSPFNVSFAAFTDLDTEDVLTYRASLTDDSDWPTWLVFDGSTQTFSGISSVAAQYQIKVTATDLAGVSASDTFLLKLQDPRAPEQKQAIPQQPPLLEDQPFDFDIPAGTFVDPTGDAFTYSATLSGGALLPSWLTLSPGGHFAGTPSNADVGEVQLTIIVTDEADNKGFADFSLTIDNVNDTPIATTIAPQSLLLNEALNLTFAAFTDVDVGDILTYGATLTDGTPLPDWLVFDIATRTFTSPPLTKAAQYPIMVTATDNDGARVSTHFTLTVDTPPTLATALADQNASENQAFHFTIPEETFHDDDAWDSLTYEVLVNGAALPSWLTFDAPSRTFGGTPDNGDVGVFSIQVTATDQSGVSVSDEGFLLSVANVNDAPTRGETIPDQDVAVGTPLEWQLAARAFSDVDAGDRLIFSATLADDLPLPSWLTFDPETRTFAGTAGTDDQGSLKIVVKAQDIEGESVFNTFDLVVTQDGAGPQIAHALPDQIATEDQAFLFQFDVDAFIDADRGDTLAYRAGLVDGSELPAWLDFNSETRTFSGQPDNAAVTKLGIKVTATNLSGFSTSDLFFLDVVNVNDPPTVAQAISSQLAPQGTPFHLDSVGLFQDEDEGDQLFYEATLQDGTPLPDWLKFDRATLAFSGTPQEEDVGFLLAVKITATDMEKATVADNFLILVTPSNTAPEQVNTIADKIAEEDALFLYEIPYTQERSTSIFFDEDIHDPLTLSAALADGSVLPAWLTFDTDTRTFVGTPRNEDVSIIEINPSLKFQVTATDWVGATAQSNIFTIEVANSNDPPVLAAQVPDRQVFPGDAFSFDLPVQTFTDEDVGDLLTFSARQANGSQLPSWMSLDANTGLLSGTPPADIHLETLNIKMTAADRGAVKVSDIFGVTVRLLNTLPTLVAGKEIADQTAQEDQSFTLKLDKETFQDVDKGDVLTWRASLSGEAKLPAWLVFDGATQTFSGTPKNADVGTGVITVKATDGDGASVSDSFDLTVANSNDAPMLAKPIPDQRVVQNTPFTYEVDAATFTDEDLGTVLSMTALLANGDPLPSWLNFDRDTRMFTSVTHPTMLETISIKVTATDNGPDPRMSAAHIFNLTTVLPNTPPTTKGIDDPRHTTQDRMFVFRLPSDTFQDADAGDKLTLSATMSDGSALPVWLTFDPGTQAFIGTPNNADVGTRHVTVTATDGDKAHVSASFALVVDNVNDAPVLVTTIAHQIAVNGQKFHTQLEASSFIDPDIGDTLTLSAKLINGNDLPTWLTFDAASHTFSGTPMADGSNQANLAIKVTATDRAGLRSSTIFNLQVLPPNAEPTLQEAIGPQTAPEDKAFIFQVSSTTFSDADADLLELSATQAEGFDLPDWLTFDRDTGTFSGQPSNSDVGTLSLQVTATDPRMQSVSDTFTLTVDNRNDAPVLNLENPIAPQRASQGSRFNFRIPGNRFIDVDVGDTLSYEAKLSGGVQLPTWLTFNPETEVLGGTPTGQDLGTLSIRLTATDDGGQSVSDTFSIQVLSPNTAPTVKNPQEHQFVAEDSAFTYQVPLTTFVDVDQGDTLTYTAASLTGDNKLPTWLHFDSATRTFFATPDNDAVGVVKVKVIATDSRDVTTSNLFDLIVTNTNDAPVLKKAIDDQGVVKNTAFKLQLDIGTFADPDKGDTLTLSASTLTGDGALPGWLAFDPETYTFSGTPSSTDVTTNIKVTATDSSPDHSEAFDIFTLRITDSNQAPTLANPVTDQVLQEDQAFSFQFASNTFDDPNGDILIYSVTGLADGSALPVWLHFYSDTRTLSATPDNANVGTLAIKLTATDLSGAKTSNTFNIKVVNVNDAPTVAHALSNQSVVKGTALKFQFPEDTFTDEDVGDVLTLTATSLIPDQNLPTWLQFDPSTRTFSGTPGDNDVGIVHVKVTASDGQASVSETFRLQVAESQSGVLLDSKVMGVTYTTPTHTGLTDANGTFQFQPGETITFSLGGIVLGQATGNRIMTPLDLSETGNIDETTNVLRLLQTLDADSNPDNGILITESVRTRAEDVSLDFNVSSDAFAANPILAGYLQESVAKTTLVSTESAWKHFKDTLANTTGEHSGETDGILTTSATSPISVAMEDSFFSYQLPTTAFRGLDSNARLTFAVSRLDGSSTLPAWLSFDTDTGLIRGTPHNNDVGTLGIFVTATDAKEASSRALVDITVFNSNDAPILEADIVDQSATRSKPFFFQIPEKSFTDVDVVHGDHLSLTATLSDGTALPNWLVFDTETGAFSGTPTTLETIIVKVTASDDAATTASDLFNLSVVNVNTAPTVENSIAKQNVPTVTEDQPFHFQFAANTFFDSDAEDILTYSAKLPGNDSDKALPDWLNFDVDTYTFSGTPTQEDVKTVHIKVTAVDGAGKTVSDSFRIDVEDSPDTPILLKDISDKKATQGTPFRFTLEPNTFTDTDPENSLTLTATRADGTALPDWLTFDDTTRTFSGTPQNAETLNIRIMATDKTDLWVADSFGLTVQPLNHAPTLKTEPLHVPDVSEGQSFRYQLPHEHFVDVDGDTLTLTAKPLSGGEALPSWLLFDADTGSFSGTLGIGTAGVWGVKVVARDPSGAEVADTFNLTIHAVNQAPQLEIPLTDQSATSGELFSFQIADGTFTDVNAGDSLSYSMTTTFSGQPGGRADWLTFDADTHSFMGSPKALDVGVINVKVTAKDVGNLEVFDTFTIHVIDLNHAPQRDDSVVLLQGQSNVEERLSAVEGEFFSASLSNSAFTDPDVGDTLSLRAANLLANVALPTWLTFDADTGVFSGTPGKHDIGHLDVKITATDVAGLKAADAFSLTVHPINKAPTLDTPIDDRNAMVGKPFQFKFGKDVFSDPNPGDVLSFKATLANGAPLPHWLTFDSDARVFIGEPEQSDVGILDIAVTARDNALTPLSVAAAFKLTVAYINHLPTLAEPVVNQTAGEDQFFSFQVPATTFADEDVTAGRDKLTLTATGVSSDGKLPDWLHFDSDTKIFSGTPDNAAVGSFGVKLQATDSEGEKAFAPFNIQVVNSNDAPVLANPILDQGAELSRPFVFRLPKDTFTDVDVGDLLTVSATLANGTPLTNSWLYFDHASATFSGTPTASDLGTLGLQVRMTDQVGATVATVFKIKVSDPNHRPTLINPLPRGDVQATEDQPFNFQFADNTFFDQDADSGDVLRYEIERLGGGPLPEWLVFDAGTRTFSGLPGNTQEGKIGIKLIAIDPYGEKAFDVFNLAVTNVNDAPKVVHGIRDQSIVEGNPFKWQLPVDTFSDEDVGTVLSYKKGLTGVAGISTDWLTFDPSTRTFSGTPGAGDVGVIQVTVTATDNDVLPLSVSTGFSLQVNAENHAPTLAAAIADQTLTQDMLFRFSVDQAFTDMDTQKGDSLTLSARRIGTQALPDWLTFDPDTGFFSGTPGNQDVGTFDIKVTATDPFALTSSDIFSVQVHNVNDAPVLTSAVGSEKTANINMPFKLDLSPTMFQDPDVGDHLTYTIDNQIFSGKETGNANWLIFDPDTLTFRGTPRTEDIGTITITLKATDSDSVKPLAAFDSFVLQVRSFNNPPVARSTPIGKQTATQDVAFSFPLPSDMFTDPDGDRLSFSASTLTGASLPGWLNFNKESGLFHGVPHNADVGTVVIKITATDSGGLKAFGNFAMEVANVNDAPTVMNTIVDQTMLSGQSLNFRLPAETFQDLDPGDVLAISTTLEDGSPLPDWLNFNAATLSFSGTPSQNNVGTVAIKVTAMEVGKASPLSVSDTFNLTVTPLNHPPILDATIGAQTATEGQLFSFQIPETTFIDTDADDLLQLTAVNLDGTALPPWLQFDENLGLFSGTPSNGDIGLLSIKVTASDASDTKAFDIFTLLVINENDAPIVANPLTNKITDLNTIFTFQVPENTFSDQDIDDVLTLDANLADGSVLPSWLQFDAETGIFSGMPTFTDLGLLSIHVTATDKHGASILAPFDIRVQDPNVSPKMDHPIIDQVILEDVPFSFQFASNTFSDANLGDTLTFTATQVDGSALPTWLSFDTAIHTFLGTPLNDDVGVVSVKVIASDGQMTAEGSFTIQVDNVNDAPTLVTPQQDQSIKEKELFQLSLPSTMFHDMDVEDVLAWHVTQGDDSDLPVWLTFDPLTLMLQGTPGVDDVGIVSVKVEATEMGRSDPLSVFDTFDIQVVAVNHAPTLAVSIGPQIATEDQPFTFQMSGATFVDTDVDDELTLSATQEDDTPLPLWLSFEETTGIFSGTPGNSDVADWLVKVRASDLSDAKVSDTFTLSVLNTNDAPTVESSRLVDQTIMEDQAFSFVVPIDAFSDVDVGDLLTYHVTMDSGRDTSWLQFDSDTLTFSGLPQNADVGSLSITLTATDKAHEEISAGFTLNVVNVNDTPTLVIPMMDHKILEDQTSSFTFEANVFEDVDIGDSLTYTAALENGTDLPSWLTFDAASRTFTSIVSESMDDTVLQVIATDRDGASVSDMFNVAVTWTVTLTLDDTTNGLLGMDTDGVTRSGAIAAVTKGHLEYNLDDDGWSATYTTPLKDGTDDGPHTVQVRQVDATGNVLSSEQEIYFTLDTVPPTMPDAALHDTTNGLDGHDTDGLTYSSVITAPTNTETDAVVEYSLDNGTQWNENYTEPTIDGVYTVLIRQTDAVGNISSEQAIPFTRDTALPETPNASLNDSTNGLSGHDTDGLTNHGAITAPTNTETGAVVEYSMDNGTSWQTSYTEPVIDGTYTVFIRQTDAVGNISSNQTIHFTLDLSLPAMPDVTLDDTTNTLPGNNIDSLTKSGAITVPTNTETGALVEYSLDNGTWRTSYTEPATDGMHTVLVRQTDAVGNVSIEQSIDFMLDTSWPATPNAVLNDTTNGLSGGDTDGLTGSGALVAPTNTELGALVAYSLDDGISWRTSYEAPTTDGTHRVLVRQTDAVGNVSDNQTINFTLDTLSPLIPNAFLDDTTNGMTGNNTDGKTNSSVILVAPTNTETGAILAYNLDDAGWSTSLTELAMDGTDDGAHIVLVRQTDAAGNVSVEQEISFTLDTLLPEIPDATLDDTTNGIAGHDTDGRTNTGVIVAPTNTETSALEAYSFDNGTTWRSIYTAPTTDGAYTVLVRQTDAVGNVSDNQTINFTLDTTAPVLTVSSATSDNATVTEAQAGDTVTVDITTDGSESGDPTATIMGHLATVMPVSGNDYTATYVATGREASSTVTFAISAMDAAGNETIPVTMVTDSVVAAYKSPNISASWRTSYQMLDQSGDVPLRETQDVSEWTMLNANSDSGVLAVLDTSYDSQIGSGDDTSSGQLQVWADQNQGEEAKSTVDTLPSTSRNDTLIGMDDNDIFDAGTDHDVLQVKAGDDILFWDGAELRIDDRSGTDALALHIVDQTLNLTTLSSDTVSRVEKIDLTENRSNTLLPDVSDLLDLSSRFDQLMVNGEDGDKTSAKNLMDWILNSDGTASNDSVHHATYTSDYATTDAGNHLAYNNVSGPHTFLVDTNIALNFVF